MTIGEGGPNSWSVEDELVMQTEIQAEKHVLPSPLPKASESSYVPHQNPIVPSMYSAKSHKRCFQLPYQTQ